jgi:hypothetical protein
MGRPVNHVALLRYGFNTVFSVIYGKTYNALLTISVNLLAIKRRISAAMEQGRLWKFQAQRKATCRQSMN